MEVYSLEAERKKFAKNYWPTIGKKSCTGKNSRYRIETFDSKQSDCVTMATVNLERAVQRWNAWDDELERESFCRLYAIL